METKYFFAKVKRINESERTLDAIASTIDLDRDKDIILPSAFEKSLKPFKDNPVILACHQHRLSSGSSPVIGSAIPDSIKIDERKVTFTMRFAETPLGEEYWQLYRDAHMRAFSIGFIPIEHEDKKDENLGWVRTYTKIELLEISAVPVPSNRRALARAKGYFETEDIKDSVAEKVKAIIEQQLTEQLGKFTNHIEDQFEEIKNILSADSGGFAKGLLGVHFDPSVTAGEKQKAEQIVSILKTALQELNL